MYATISTFPSTVISDAFEAATNGMHNPEAFEQLEICETESDWKNLIYAVRAFYNQDFVRMDELLKEVSGQSDAGSLKRVMYHMAATGDKNTKLTRNEERLAGRITEDSRFLKSAIEDVCESIQYGEDLFIETVSLLIKEVKQKTPEAASRLALWSFKACAEQDFSDETLADNVLMLFGQAEGLRLIALSLIESEPDSALICFTRSLIRRIVDKTIDKAETAGYLEIIEALLSACAEEDPVILDINELLSMLESEMNLYFGFSSEKHADTAPGKIAVMKERLSGSGAEIIADREPVAEKNTVPLRPSSTVVQLELF